MAAGAFARIVIFGGSVARFAVRIIGVVERYHHPAADLMAVGAGALVVIIGCISSVAIGAFTVQVMGVISFTPILTCIVTAAAILTVVVFWCFTQVALRALFNRVTGMVGLGIRPGVGIVTFIARTRRRVF
jgi:hypothetical protein